MTPTHRYGLSFTFPFTLLFCLSTQGLSFGGVPASLQTDVRAVWDVRIQPQQYPSYAVHDTPLIAAIKQGDLRLVKRLVAQGAEVNQKDQRGYTALMWAENRVSKPEDLKLVRFLLDKGADPNRTDGWGNTALMNIYNARAGSPQLNLAMVNLLLAKGANVNAKNKGGVTALHMATHESPVSGSENSIAVIRRLLKAGANLEARGGRLQSSQFTPLLYACARSGNASAVETLLKAGADKKAVNRLGYNALELAVSTQNTFVVEVLLRYGFHAEQRGPEGETPLMVAAGIPDKFSQKMVRLLLQHGAKINSRDKRGQTPLLWAVTAGKILDPDFPPGTSMDDPKPLSEIDYRPMVRLLLDSGADLHTKNKAGKTALMLAREMDNPRLVAFLQQAGATE